MDTNSNSARIGPPLDRRDGPLKVCGRATYAYEHRGRRETAYGFMVTSTIAKGHILSIDCTAAEQALDVIAVLTFKNAPPQAPPHPRVTSSRYDRAEPYLFSPDVRYYGEPVALVIAKTFEAARHAAGLVKLRYESASDAALDLVACKWKAYKPERVNGGAKTDTTQGDFGSAFAGAAVKIDATYVVPYEHNMPMEPHASLAIWEQDKLTLYGSQQNVSAAQSTLAKTFQIPKEQVHLLTHYVGGGFGSKVPVHAQAVLAALGAKAIGHPVKVAQTRPQMFANTNHRPKALQRLRLGADSNGKLLAIAHEACLQTSPHDEFIEQAAAFSRTMYEAPHRLHTHRGVILNLPTSDIMRAPGEEPGSLAMECAMDELAHALGMDPVALRILNEPKVDPETHLPFSSRSLVECLQEGARRFGWDQRPIMPRSRREGEVWIGYGVAAGTFPTIYSASSASVRLHRDGTVLARLGATDIGTGTYTILAQIAAECLGIPLDRIRVEMGDSSLPAAAGSGGSMAAASTGSGLQLACEKLLAAREPGESMEAFIARLPPEGLEVTAGHQGAQQPKKYSMHVYGAQFAEVAVDGDTGEIRVRRMLGVFASGRILNAKTARSQLIGGMIMGLGAALSEESILDLRDGSFVNHDLAEYHIPVHADIPEIDAVFVPEVEDKANPLGVKGLGEIGIVGAGAALANAVFNATGVRVREFPITLDKVMRDMEAP